MLEDAVRKLKGEKVTSPFRTPLFFKINFYIPDTYINDEKQKIEFYKRIEACECIEEVEELEKELMDRFGNPPEEVRILFELERIRVLASTIEIEEIKEDTDAIKIKMSNNTRIEPQSIINKISEDKRLSIDHRERDILTFYPRSESKEKRLNELKKWLQQISISSS